MSGISYTTAGAGGLMFTVSGTFTTAQLNGGAVSDLFPGIVTQIYFNVTANPTWPANLPDVYLVMDTAISNQVQITFPNLAADPFNANFLPQDPFGALLWYQQSYASSFLNVQAGAGGLVGVVINYTALCWIPS
jgi:hypothetical protein